MEYDVDDPVVATKVPILVLDADASQHSAVYDAMCGKNLVIQGPPGTGKSQTIANIIAAALSSGKRILFIADKLAAMQVVKDRLDKVGLGDFCLELHSGKARKTDVLASLDQRLQRRPSATSPGRLDARLRELATTRAVLTDYVQLLNRKFGTLELTVHDLLWADRRRRDREGEEARSLDSIELSSLETLSLSDVETRRTALDRFERVAAPILASFGCAEAHPWWGLTRANLPSVDMQQAVRDTADAAACMANVADAAQTLHPFGMPPDTTLDVLLEAARGLAALRVSKEANTAWFAAFADAGIRDLAVGWQQACRRYQRALEIQARLLGLPEGSAPAEVAERLEGAWSRVARVVSQGVV